MKKIFLTYLDVVLKFFGLQRIPNRVEIEEPVKYNDTEVTVVDEQALEDLRLARFNEILEVCDKTSVLAGPKWDMDKKYPVHFEPEVIESHNLDPDRPNKVSYGSLIDDEHRKILTTLKKQDPLYVNGITRRKARAKLIGENTNVRTNKKNKGHDNLDLTTNNPEDGAFKSLMVEIMKNSIED